MRMLLLLLLSLDVALAEWSVGAVQGSCTSHCVSLGKVCNDATMLSRNSEVDSSAEARPARGRIAGLTLN